MAAPSFICANWDPKHTDCQKLGKSACKNCRLVLYCGAACQRSHWSHHKSECKSPLGKETWQPAWALESRKPAFIGDGIGKHFGATKYLWGNIPAYDVLQLESNEGKNYARDLRILFAASGDLRNIIMTIARLPSSYNHSIEITINDRDLDIVARNIIMLLIALTFEEVDEAVDCIIHIWYSALVRQSDIDILQGRIRPLLEDVCKKIKEKTSGSLLGKTWKFGQRSLRVVLEKSSWDSLLSFFHNPAGLTTKRAHDIRADITLAESRIDYRDRHMYCLQAPERIAFNKFRQDGLLLPFGYPRSEFCEPNPTLFQTDTWPMKDSADPLEGWPSEDLADTSSGFATADIYGKLFYYIRGLLRSFLDRLSSSTISFKMFQLDVMSLDEHLASDTFNRIEVSNISDAGYVGIHGTLALMIPLLQPPIENPHATLITLFMNSVAEVSTEQDQIRDMAPNSQTAKKLLKYLPPKGRPSSPYDPVLIKFSLGRDLVTTYNHIFDRYLLNYKFREAAEYFGATMKEKHTIIDKWPYRLKLRPGQARAQDEFDRLLSRGTSGQERYIEWKRANLGMP